MSANGKEKVAGLPEHFTHAGQTSCTYPATTTKTQKMYFFSSFLFSSGGFYSGVAHSSNTALKATDFIRFSNLGLFS